MKKLKNKLFYINAFFLYLILIFVFSILTLMFLYAPSMSFLTKYSVPYGKVGSLDTIEVVIDDISIQSYKWPWAKDKFSDLLDYFHTYTKTNIIGFDMLPKSFDENNKADLSFLNQVSKMDNLVSSFVPLYLTANEPENNMPKKFKKAYSLEVDIKNVDFPSYYNSFSNLNKKMLEATKNYASVKISENQTGDIISAIFIIKIDDEYYPSLPFKMYLMANNTNNIIIDRDYVIVPKTGLKIPYELKQDGTATLNIRYYENFILPHTKEELSYSHLVVPASKILDTYYALKSGITPKTHPDLYTSGKYINPDTFNNKIVFIGQNISGPSADVLKTPMNDMHPGVDIQATIFDNLQEAYLLHYAGFSASFAIFLILSILAFVILMRSSFIKGLFSIILIDIVFLIFVYLMAYCKGIMFTYSVPLVCQFVTIVFGYSFKFITENRNKEKIKQAMGKYLSQDIMKNVVSNIDDLKLGGKRAVVTVLFSDIRGFTSLSEKMSAEEVSVILNEYFAEMEPIITKYNGVINKFIGDAVMAIFGEPIQDINHPQNAVKCAYEMLKKVEYLREKWLFEGKPKIEIGVGINTGEVFIGNIGTETRMEYTVIGDTVNLASRIESYNKVYRTNLLVSSSTYEHITDIADVIKISEVQIRGKAKKMNIYEVLRIDLKK